MLSEYSGRVCEEISASFDNIKDTTVLIAETQQIKNINWEISDPMLNEISVNVNVIRRFLLVD